MDFVLKKSSISKGVLIIYLFLLSTSFNAVTIEGKNLAFIFFSFIGLYITLHLRPSIPQTIDKSIFGVLFILTISFIINFRHTEINSFLYSLFYIITYIILASHFKSEIPVETFKRAILFILAGYFALLLIGQIYVLLGLFKGTFISKGLIHGQFGTLYEAASGFRYYSLSTEPSLAAFIIITSFYVYLEADKHQSAFSRRDFVVWVMAVYMIISFQSGYGVILFFIMLFFKMSLRNSLIIIIIGFLLAVAAVYARLPIAERIVNIFSSLNLEELERLKKIDSSAAYRILPFYYYVTNIDLLDYHFYFGYGAGTASAFLIPFLFKVPVSGFEGGFLPQFLYDYGILFGLVFLFFLRREVLTKWFSFETAVILFMLTNANFNTQVFWFVVTCFALNKWYQKAHDFN